MLVSPRDTCNINLKYKKYYIYIHASKKVRISNQAIYKITDSTRVLIE